MNDRQSICVLLACFCLRAMTNSLQADLHAQERWPVRVSQTSAILQCG